VAVLALAAAVAVVVAVVHAAAPARGATSRGVDLAAGSVRAVNFQGVPGRIVINDGAGPETLTVPWEHGEPTLDMPTLLAGGMSPARAKETVRRWTIP